MSLDAEATTKHLGSSRITPSASQTLNTIKMTILIPPSQSTTLVVDPKDTAWNIKLQMIQKFPDIKDGHNYSLLVSCGGKNVFLDDKAVILKCGLESNEASFVPKKVGIYAQPPKDPEAAPTPKNLKKFMDDLAKGNIEKIKERCDKGFNPNFITENGENDNVALINELVERGALLDFRCSSEQSWKTPLHVAAGSNRNSALNALLRKGAWIDAPDSKNLSPLYYAVVNGCHECVHNLLQGNANMDYRDRDKNSLLHLATFKDFSKVVALLIDYGADMDLVNNVDCTPLHIAATRNSHESAQRLLFRGADIDKVNIFGKTSHTVATELGNDTVAELIVEFALTNIIPPPPALNEKKKRPVGKRTPKNWKVQKDIQKSHNTLEMSQSIAMLKENSAELGLIDKSRSSYSLGKLKSEEKIGKIPGPPAGPPPVPQSRSQKIFKSGSIEAASDAFKSTPISIAGLDAVWEESFARVKKLVENSAGQADILAELEALLGMRHILFQTEKSRESQVSTHSAPRLSPSED